MVTEDKNWFGMTPHPTDEYIHWSQKESEKLAKQLRTAYDELTKTEDNKILLQLLLAAAEKNALLEVLDTM